MTPPEHGQLGRLDFDQQAIILALLMASGVREGRWCLGVTMQLNMQQVTLSDGVTRSVGAVAAFQGLSLQRVAEGQSIEPGVAVVDAALLDPAPGSGATVWRSN